MFELQPVDPVGIDALDVEIVEVLVERVHDAHAERERVAVEAEVHAVDEEVLGDRKVAVGLEEGVDEAELVVDLALFGLGVEDGGPERVVAVLVVERDGVVVAQQILVAHALALVAPVIVQVAVEEVADGVDVFLPADEVAHRLAPLACLLRFRLVSHRWR